MKRLSVVSTGVVVAGPVALKTTVASLGPMIDRKAQLLQAFACTIIPCIDENQKRLSTVLDDRFFGFQKFKWLLCLDLKRRSRKLHRTNEFADLSVEQRSAVIADALSGKGIMTQLYSGAIQLLQLTFYTGFTLAPECCPQINFTAEYDDSAISYYKLQLPNVTSLTEDGNLK